MYTLTSNIEQVKRNSDGIVFKCLDGLFLYEDYKKWLAAGNVPFPADSIPNPAIIEIDEKLAELDKRKIRPLAEGDAVYLGILNAQTIELRTARALLPKMV